MKQKFPVIEWQALLEVSKKEAHNGSLGLSEEEWEELLARRQDAGNRSELAAHRLSKEKSWNVELVERALGPLPDYSVIKKLAEELWIELGVHDVLRKKGRTQTTRGTNALPKTFIAYMGVVLLNQCMITTKPPPIELVFLIRDTLDVTRFGHNDVRSIHEEKVAALYLANHPDASISKIAKEVGVNKSTVSRWINSQHFQKRVERLKADDFEREDQTHMMKRGFGLPEEF